MSAPRKSTGIPARDHPCRRVRLAAAFPPLLVLLSLGGIATAGDEPLKASNVIGLSNRPGDFGKMQEEVEPLVRKLAEEKSGEERKKIEDRLAGELGDKAIEVLVRYREPHLIPVFSRLLDHKDLFVRRLAVFGLERNNAVGELDNIAKRLDDESFLVREIAALTICMLHTRGKVYSQDFPKTREASKALEALRKAKKDHIAALEARTKKEGNPFAKAALEAALFGMEKKPPVRIHEEPVIQDAPVRMVPKGESGQLGQWASIKYNKQGGNSKHPPTREWGYPAIVYPREILDVTSDPPLKPLPEKNNSFHFGHDCAWFLEGSGVYALADGVVRLVQHGGDWGGIIVVEHRCKDGTYVNALNGHCGMWLFAEAGTPVKKGQLLGVMGLGFSPENGGHGSHNHFGMFAGPFDAAKCFGRGGAGTSVEGWLVPANFLGPLVEGKNIVPESYK